jgi:hypothetical protein
VSHSGLEPIKELDNVGVLEALEHLQFVVDHLVVAFDVLLQDDLDGAFSLGWLCFSDDAVGSSSESPAKLVLGSVVAMSVGVLWVGGVLDELLVIAVGLAVEFVEHAGDYTGGLIRQCLERV